MSQVVIGDILPYTQATATLGQVLFGTNWTANYASDVVVYITPAGDDANDVTQILTYPADFSVSFIGSEQEVQVLLSVGAGAGDRVTITRQTPADRLNLYSNTNFTPNMLNQDFGILTLVDQQAQLVDQRIAPRYNYSELIVDVVDTILPKLGANQFWAKNAGNTAIIAVDISTISGGGTITQIDTGLGLTGGPITTTGTISFATMPANTFWGNITGSTALPTEVPTTYFLKAANNLSDLSNVATARINLGLEIGVNVEAWSEALDSIAGLITSGNELLVTTASNTYAVLGPAANSVLVTDGSNVPSLSMTLPLTVQDNITKLGAMAEALNMNSHQINNVTDPTNPQDAATRAYVDSISGAFLPLIGGTMSGAINMGNHKITNLTDPSAAQDAVTLSYLNTALGDYLPLSGGTMSGAINMGSSKITNLLDPTNPQDAATKNYVDTVATGLTVQPSCYAATTANLTATYANGASGIGATLTNSGALAAFSTDGTSPPTNARILVWSQSTTFQNGIYTLTNQGSGAVAWVLTRATDYDQPAEIQPGDLVIINNGTLYSGTSFIETASVSTIGTDPILFSQFTFSATAVLLKANNLSDVANTTTAFNNISPLTTKGDLLTYNSGNVRLGVGSTGQLLQANSGAATGLAYTTAVYPATTTANQILYSSSTNTIVGLSSIAGGVLVTNNLSVPSFLANPGVAGKMLQSANAAIPAWSTPTYPSASGTAGKMIVSDGTNNVYSTPTFPNASATALKIIVSDGTNWVASTPTYASTSAANKIMISDGTNWVASTATYAAPGTAGNVLTSDGTNWVSSAATGSGTVNTGLQNQLAYYAANGTAVSGLSTANSGVLVTSSGGVPSISSTLPSGLTIPGYAASGANGDITSMTGLTGSIGHPTAIVSSTGLKVLEFNYTASAVNYLSIYNSVAGQPVPIDAVGTDASIALALRPKNGNVKLLDNTSTIAVGLQFYNAATTHSVTLKAATLLAADPTFVLPGADGSANAPLITDGSGNLSFLTAAWSTFSPTVTLVGGSGNTVPTYSTAVGRYKQIGNTVFCNIYLNNTSGGTAGAGTGTLNIALPVAVSASITTGQVGGSGTLLVNASKFIAIPILTASATTVTFGYQTSIGTQTTGQGDSQNNAVRQIALSFFYEV